MYCLSVSFLHCFCIIVSVSLLSVCPRICVFALAVIVVLGWDGR